MASATILDFSSFQVGAVANEVSIGDFVISGGNGFQAPVVFTALDGVKSYGDDASSPGVGNAFVLYRWDFRPYTVTSITFGNATTSPELVAVGSVGTNQFLITDNQQYTGSVNLTNVTFLQFDSFVGEEGAAGIKRIVIADVPEPATWAMMIVGFGAIGFTMRRRQKVTPRITFA